MRLSSTWRACGRTLPCGSLRHGLEEALLLLCATPLATVDELSRFGRFPASTLRERLGKLAKRGLVDSVPHHLSVLGTRPQRRYFPTEKGVTAAGTATKGRTHMLRAYPVSKQWFRLLAERLDAVAVLHRVASMIADADPQDDPVRVDHYRNDPYDMLVTLSGGRTIGLIRQGRTLPTSRLRYRLRSVERLDSSDAPFVTLVLTHADQATRRAVRSLGDPSEHLRTFVATEGELLAGDHTGVVWQQCGGGLGEAVRIDADASLAGILALVERLLDTSYSFLGKSPKPNPSDLYPSGVQASMSEPTEQLSAALSVRLTRAEKDALDLLAAWPLCTREQLAGLMGCVTLRRVNQVLRSLSQHGLVRADEQRDRLLAGFRWILVDEYQDIKELEYRLISALAGRTKRDQDQRLNLFAVGDDDQNIYTFSGSSSQYIKRFEVDYRAKPSFLTENYRSTGHIIRASNSVIEPANLRMKADHPITINRIRTRDRLGGVWERIDPVTRGKVQILPSGFDPVSQAQVVVQELKRMDALDPKWDWSNCAVIARKWDLLDPVRALCHLEEIPVQVSREDFTATWQLRETQALLK